MRLLMLTCPFVKKDLSQAWWHIPIILAPGRLRQEDPEFRTVKKDPPSYPTAPKHRSHRSKLRSTDCEERSWA